MVVGRYNFNIEYKQGRRYGNFNGVFEVSDESGGRSEIIGNGIDKQASITTRSREINGRIIWDDKHKQSEIILIVDVPITDENLCDVLYQFNEMPESHEDYEGSWRPVRKIKMDRVISGPHESFSGIDYYISKFIEITPNKKDEIAQPARMKLHKIGRLVGTL